MPCCLFLSAEPNTNIPAGFGTGGEGGLFVVGEYIFWSKRTRQDIQGSSEPLLLATTGNSISLNKRMISGRPFNIQEACRIFRRAGFATLTRTEIRGNTFLAARKK
jgi:hypothetical protein